MPTENLKRFGGVQRSSFVFDSLIEKHIQNVQINWKTKNITPSEQCVTKITYIMHNVQDYRILYYNAVRPAIC
jgi:hypothetical protein